MGPRILILILGFVDKSNKPTKSAVEGWFVFLLREGFKDRQQRIAADLQHSRLSLTYSLTSWVEVCTIYDKIDNLEKYLGIWIIIR